MKNMVVESLNIGLPKKEIFHGREIITGICKEPVAGPLRLGRLGFEPSWQKSFQELKATCG